MNINSILKRLNRLNSSSTTRIVYPIQKSILDEKKTCNKYIENVINTYIPYDKYLYDYIFNINISNTLNPIIDKDTYICPATINYMHKGVEDRIKQVLGKKLPLVIINDVNLRIVKEFMEPTSTMDQIILMLLELTSSVISNEYVDLVRNLDNWGEFLYMLKHPFSWDLFIILIRKIKCAFIIYNLKHNTYKIANKECLNLNNFMLIEYINKDELKIRHSNVSH